MLSSEGASTAKLETARNFRGAPAAPRCAMLCCVVPCAVQEGRGSGPGWSGVE